MLTLAPCRNGNRAHHSFTALSAQLGRERAHRLSAQIQESPDWQPTSRAGTREPPLITSQHAPTRRRCLIDFPSQGYNLVPLPSRTWPLDRVYRSFLRRAQQVTYRRSRGGPSACLCLIPAQTATQSPPVIISGMALVNSLHYPVAC